MARYLPPCTVLVGLVSCFSGNSFATEERITLMLTGSACTENHQAIDRALNQITGVQHVDVQAIPGHILVDIETGTVTAKTLEDRVNDILPTHASCRAEIMKSCISADPRPASAEVR